jgi:hypothetical protein
MSIKSKAFMCLAFIASTPEILAAKNEIHSLPKAQINAALERTVGRWNSCGGRFKAYAKLIGSNQLKLPRFSLRDQGLSTRSEVIISRKTKNLPLSLERGISTWLGLNFERSPGAGTFYTADVPFREATFRPLDRPCETIVHHWQSLGPSIPTKPVYSEKYGIKILSNGFEYTDKAIATKRRGFIANRAANMRYLGWDEQQVLDFEARALRMTQTPHFFADLVDDSIDQIKDLWRGCGGAYKRFVDTSYNPKRITSVTIEPSVFIDHNYSPTAWLGGTFYLATGAIRILSLYMNARDAGGVPAYTTFSAEAFMSWEIGHTFYGQYGYRPTSFETEGGNKRPCDFLGNKP